MSRHYVWLHDVGTRVHGGSKATLDAYDIAKRAGWEAFDTTLEGRGFRRLFSFFNQLVTTLRTRRDSVFLVQLPAYGPANIILAHLLVRLFPSKILLHDIDRLKKPKFFNTEDLYKCADDIIYTGKLVEYLDARRIAGKSLSRLEMWDYLVDQDFRPPECRLDAPVLFAGNLAKDTVNWLYIAGFPRPPLVLYGNRCEVADLGHPEDIYGGPFAPEHPNFRHAVGWGLVWTGAKTGHETLSFDYEMICQSHKFSLYMACGLPVIVWEQAHIATIVRQYECGVLISDLSRMQSAIASVTKAQYAVYRQSALQLGERVRRGDFLLEQLKLD